MCATAGLSDTSMQTTLGGNCAPCTGGADFKEFCVVRPRSVVVCNADAIGAERVRGDTPFPAPAVGTLDALGALLALDAGALDAGALDAGALDALLLPSSLSSSVTRAARVVPLLGLALGFVFLFGLGARVGSCSSATFARAPRELDLRLGFVVVTTAASSFTFASRDLFVGFDFVGAAAASSSPIVLVCW